MVYTLMSVETVVAEESAYQMVSEATVDRTNAIQKIMDGIYVHNREHADVISSICSLFIELSHYGQTLLTSYKLVTFCMRRSRGERYSGHGRPYVCLSVPRHVPTLLHGPGCKLGEWYVVPCCALLGGFAIGARTSRLWQQHSAEQEMSSSACTRSVPGWT